MHSNRRVVLHPEALEEVEHALRWYQKRSPRAALAFLDEIESAIHAIEAAPHQWPLYASDLHKYILKRFPFSLIYRILEERTEVVAIAHSRRQPDYWRSRVQ